MELQNIQSFVKVLQSYSTLCTEKSRATVLCVQKKTVLCHG